MKRSKFSEQQVAYALRQADSGTAVGDVCRQVGISEATFYAWKKKYAHLGVSEVRRLRQIEKENTRLKRLVADLSFDKHMLSEALREKSDARTAPRAGWLVSRHLPGQLRAGLPTSNSTSFGLANLSRINQCRPHGTLGHLTPNEFTKQRQEDRIAEGGPLQLHPVS